MNLCEHELSGTIPKWIEQLELLDFSNNQPYGPITEEVTLLDQMIWLSLANNKFTGALPLYTVTYASQITNCNLGETQLYVPDTPPYAIFNHVCSLTPQHNCKICKGPGCESMKPFIMVLAENHGYRAMDGLPTHIHANGTGSTVVTMKLQSSCFLIITYLDPCRIPFFFKRSPRT